MRILLLGGTGMLCHELFQAWKTKFDVHATMRSNEHAYKHLPNFASGNLRYQLDVRNEPDLIALLTELRPDWVINGIGVVKQHSDANQSIPSIELNALFPHRLAVLCKAVGAKVINLSTDCVFSGKKGMYTEQDIPDPVDQYGRTKFLGEISQPHCITLRYSKIGLELNRKQGLVEWFLAQRGTIKGYRRAIYSGFTTMEMVRILERVISEPRLLGGIWHVASTPINKFDLLSQLSKLLQRTDVQLQPSDTFVCDRSMDGSRFAALTGYRAPAWTEMLSELAGRIKSRKTLTEG